MSRRHAASQDPIGRRVLPEEALKLLTQTLYTMSPLEKTMIELRFGLRDGRPRSLVEIGRILGFPQRNMRSIESKVMSKIRHPSRSDHLRGLLDEHLRPIPEHIRTWVLGGTSENRPLVHCDQHGWSDPGTAADAVQVCGNCPCALTPNWQGRPRKYCSDACRQSAYRARKGRR